MNKNLLRLLIIIASLAVILALAYAIYYFFISDPALSFLAPSRNGSFSLAYF
jgi:flagellar basal body-associated protein FliL